MFAIVECGGKQYKAEKDAVLSVEKLDADILARLCFAFQCRVEDILEYVV